MKVGIVIPTYRRAATLEQAVGSLMPQLSAGDMIIVVNAGAGNPPEKADSAGRVPIIGLHVGKDCWWAAATNIGAAEAVKRGCTHVLTFNDDSVAAPDLLGELKTVVAREPRSIVAAVCNYLAEPRKVYFAGRVRARWTDRFIYLNHNEAETVLPKGERDVGLLHGMCTMFPVQVFSEIGYFDSGTFPHLFADDDLLLRAARAGYRLIVALDAKAYNDRALTGVNPYRARLSLGEVAALFTSRKSVYQVTRRTLFLWRYRRSFARFLLTWFADYGRVVSLVFLGWLLPPKRFAQIVKGPR